MIKKADNIKKIAAVKNNIEKQATYREQLGKYKKALNNEFYFEAMLIVYAMIEDRMRSFLYYIGALRRADDSNLNVSKTKGILRRLYFGSDEAAFGQKMDLSQISTKENLIRSTVIWAIEYEGIPEDYYLAVLKREYVCCLDMEGLLSVLSDVDAWRKYRNEIIHGLLNKNVNSVNDSLKERVEEGMYYARFIDSQVKALKRKDNIRKKMKIKRQAIFCLCPLLIAYGSVSDIRQIAG